MSTETHRHTAFLFSKEVKHKILGPAIPDLILCTVEYSISNPIFKIKAKERCKREL